ncbi:lysosomal acid lipase/cholesteryl ester hydrolase-like [Bradysia coprophila]|uniref:lysosomal acid lipase/cholesteryl ester hydrolase-like n=1 Tax=Bradysia coprophila TaxID=38358 RepID=UPI00187DB5E2|nr:lysosomal acid lipase/cholesteryl ester hydrolase-like [Bradysia coprophila]
MISFQNYKPTVNDISNVSLSFFSENVIVNIRIIKSEGYHAELHSVITDDAYILSVHRIRPPHPTAKIVLIMHGLQVNSFSFVLPGNQRSLAFELANNGYDVWIGNARGTEFSKKHQSLHPNSAKFWDFSFHEIAAYFSCYKSKCLTLRGKFSRCHSHRGTVVLEADVEAAIEIFRPMIIGIDKMVGWNHADFLIAKDLAVVNEKIMKLMKQHSQFD